jgi:hypothetical protein
MVGWLHFRISLPGNDLLAHGFSLRLILEANLLPTHEDKRGRRGDVVVGYPAEVDT